MPREVEEQLDPSRGGLYVDATVGMGGHAGIILAACPDSRLLGIDRDAEALAIARKRLAPFGDRVTLVHADYRELPAILDQHAGTLGAGRSGTLAGLVADLGISSFQLGAEGRGFSFQRDEPLDMRMDRSGGPTAADLVSSEREEDLADIFYRFGEERRSRRVAKVIVERRRREPIRTTGDLARLVARAVGRSGRIHPATRVFQALRIAVNDELSGIDTFVNDSVEALQARGRLVILAFHSLEDRLVKTTLHHLSNLCTCPRSFPRCACGSPDRVRLLTRKPLRPSAQEMAANPRSRSAKLRAAERL
jgi:16S rRNA (cytosine1402-N4)-methyltransferase